MGNVFWGHAGRCRGLFITPSSSPNVALATLLPTYHHRPQGRPASFLHTGKMDECQAYTARELPRQRAQGKQPRFAKLWLLCRLMSMVNISSLTDTGGTYLHPLRCRGLIIHGQITYLITLCGQIMPPCRASTHLPPLRAIPRGIPLLALSEPFVLDNFWT